MLLSGHGLNHPVPGGVLEGDFGLLDFPILERISGRDSYASPLTCLLIARKETVIHFNFGGHRLLRHAPMIAKATSWS